MMPYFKEFFGIIAIILTFLAFIPYIRSILKGTTKPHVFSWVIWGATTLIVFFAQVTDNGGAGAWSTGISGALTVYVAILAYYKKSDIAITSSDWFFFLLAISAIPFWYFTVNPLWAVILLTSIDAVGFFPTIRKAYSKPFEEQLLSYVFIVARNIVSIIALENYSTVTVLFPLVITVISVVLIAVMIFRRRC